jgi:excisionase family DNA binding protein
MPRGVSRPAAGPPMEPLLSVKQVASTLNVCSKTVYRHIAEGRLKAVRAGCLLRISATSVRAFLEQSGMRHQSSLNFHSFRSSGDRIN